MGSTTKSTAGFINDVYARALARAKKSGIRIMGRGHMRDADRTPFVAVSSSKEPNRWYIVVVGRTRMWCDCYAGMRDTLCQHRALVHEELLRLWRAERDRIEREEEAALAAALRELNEALQQPASSLLGAAGVLTAPVRGVAPVISQRCADELLQPARREQIRGYTDTRPVTIWKS